MSPPLIIDCEIFQSQCTLLSDILFPSTEIPLEPVTVLQRLRDDGDPIKGNYCPAGSTKPNSACSGGSYCPNISTSILCPAGYFCKAQSIAPRKCNVLTTCPPGTESPIYSRVAFLTAGLVSALCGPWFMHPASPCSCVMMPAF